MKAVKLNKELVPAFVEYFNAYSKEQDESFPPGDNYKPDIDEPAYVLIDESENILGAAALMPGNAYREAGTGRFRIFHCVRNEISHYRLLLDEILKHTEGLDYIYCFIEDSKTETRKIWESLGFKIRRYSWVLKRKTEDFAPPMFPQGFELKTFTDGTDEQAWCDIINESFAGMDGHVHFYPEKIAELKKDPSYIAEGMKMLWHDKKPVGTILLITENENGEPIIFIEAVSILNSYQGRGLGKNMLRAGIEFGKNFGVNNVMLSVNAENEKAVELYLNEGFEKETLIICYYLEMH